MSKRRTAKDNHGDVMRVFGEFGYIDDYKLAILWGCTTDAARARYNYMARAGFYLPEKNAVSPDDKDKAKKHDHSLLVKVDGTVGGLPVPDVEAGDDNLPLCKSCEANSRFTADGRSIHLTADGDDVYCLACGWQEDEDSSIRGI